ncbi:MAG TPA: hypothetical protein VGR66_07140 [Candidatus Eisenbacteria bacterium]|nr:hypothetical protein [Candidatus Eisenbacteria bacterium]
MPSDSTPPKPKRRLKWVLFVLLGFVALALIDYGRAVNGQNPIFSIRGSVMEDGGTATYAGLGYSLTIYAERVDMSHPLVEHPTKDGIDHGAYLREGPELTCWFPPWRMSSLKYFEPYGTQP